MALFKQKDLREQGFTEEQIAYIMTEAQRALGANYVSKSDSEEAVSKAREEALQGVVKDPTQSEQYLKLLARADKLEALQAPEFGRIKAPYRDMIWDKLDHAEGHKPYAEQLDEVATQYPDVFAAAEEPKPAFGTAPKGAAPTGGSGPSFMDTWGYIPRKG